MITVNCPKCSNGSGHISAFNHVKGGVCFKCGGTGTIQRKTKPVESKWFVAMQKWEDPSDCNYAEGEFINTFSFKAKSLADAQKKLNKRLLGCGREFYAVEK